jgi:ATP-binding cassette subfamily F protein 3
VDRKAQRRQEAEDRQRLAGLRKPLDATLKKVERRMEEAAQRLQVLDGLIADPDFYSDARRDERLNVLEEHGALSKEHAALEEQWLDLQEQLEALTAG